ncbi:MAG: polysaccharide biosynthesis/export family protein, partial [Microcystaceae cyanobacterium]
MVMFPSMMTVRVTRVILSGCLSLLSLTPVQAQIPPQAAKAAPVAPSVLPQESEYVLGPGDRVGMSIYQIDDLKGEFPVLVDGTIGFPLIGTIKVQGKTIPQLTETLRQQYKKYIKRPDITVILLQPRP